MIVTTADDVRIAMEAIYKGHQRERYLVDCYTAFCINCVEDPNQTNFNLATAVQFGIADIDNEPKAIAYIKQRFHDWVIGSAFHSVVEIFGSYLNFVFVLLRLLEIEYFDKRIHLASKQRSFEQKGINEKLKILNREFGFDPLHGDVVRTMNNVRNVIVHNAGFVKEHNCNERSHLILRWKGMQFKKMTTNGDYVNVPDEHRGPVLAGPGDHAVLDVLVKEKRFNVGEKIELSPYEIGDISWCVSGVMSDIKEKVLAEASKAVKKGKKHNKARVEIPTQRVAPGGIETAGDER